MRPLAGLVAGLGADLAAGFGLLTRLPVGWLVREGMPFRPGRAVWTYPLVGLVVGGAEGGCLWLGHRIGLAPNLVAAWTLAVAVLLTGGLHEDGLADMTDGFGGGCTPERRLAIMRDSRIGSYGALALVLSLAIRGSALAVIAGFAPGRGLALLLATGALSRAAMLPVLSLPPARPDGLGRSLGTVTVSTRIVALVIAVVVVCATLAPLLAAGFLLLAFLLGIGIAAMARARIGGSTGDVLGACVVVVECGLLTLATL
jgi:adenosylcobinamide-GDP ribazoletransferase